MHAGTCSHSLSSELAYVFLVDTEFVKDNLEDNLKMDINLAYCKIGCFANKSLLCVHSFLNMNAHYTGLFS